MKKIIKNLNRPRDKKSWNSKKKFLNGREKRRENFRHSIKEKNFFLFLTCYKKIFLAQYDGCQLISHRCPRHTEFLRENYFLRQFSFANDFWNVDEFYLAILRSFRMKNLELKMFFFTVNYPALGADLWGKFLSHKLKKSKEYANKLCYQFVI